MTRIPFLQKQIDDAVRAKKSLTLNTHIEEGVSNRASDTFSYSGSDIIALVYIPQQINNVTQDPGFIEIEDKLQTLTVSSARSVSPVRRLGETTPLAYTRGSRTIAGSMVFTTGLRDAFVNALTKSVDDGEPLREPVLFVDQLPKFSMVLQANNELGGISTALLVNITLTNFGTTFSIDDIYTESTFTYVAEQYMPLSQTLANNQNEINKLIRQRQEALDQTIGDLYESEFTQMLSNAANRQAVLNNQQRQMYGSVLTADQQSRLDRLGVSRRSYELEVGMGRMINRHLHRFSRDGG
ncbi:hypothetical protein N8457_00400 [bacterium]|nr:hypothetical protein [bacterium]